MSTVTPKACVEDALRGRITLPMIPRVVRTSLELLRDPRSGVREVSNQLAQDPVLSARVLRLANSSFYGGRRSISSIENAISAIGTEALNTMLVACGVTAAFSKVPGVNLRDFWMHAAVSAHAAQLVAHGAGRDKEAAFLAGLLHETGHLILCMAWPDLAATAFTSLSPVHGAELEVIEVETCGYGHPEVSALWCRSLQLPAEIEEAVAAYLQPLTAAPDSLAAIVHVAAIAAASIALGETARQAMDRIDERLMVHTRIERGHLVSILDEQYDELRVVGASL